MAWSNRPGVRIPNWVKDIVHNRQAGCCATIDKTVCWGTIDEYDHIINVKATRMDRRDLNDPDLLQGLCIPCHRLKTQAEAKAARARAKRKPRTHPADA